MLPRKSLLLPYQDSMKVELLPSLDNFSSSSKPQTHTHAQNLFTRGRYVYSLGQDFFFRDY